MTRALEILVFGAIAVALHAAAAPQMAGRVVPDSEPAKRKVLTVAAPPPAVSRHVSDWERRPVVLSNLRTPRAPNAVRSPGSVATVARPRRAWRPRSVATPRRDEVVASAVATIPAIPLTAAVPEQGRAPDAGARRLELALASSTEGPPTAPPARPAALSVTDGGPLFHVAIPPLPPRAAEDEAQSSE